MSEQPPEPPEAEEQHWTAGQIALVVFCAGLVVAVVLNWLGRRGIIEESLAAAAGTVVFLCLAIGSGLVGWQKRRQEDWRTAATAYRLAVWCLVLALAVFARYYPAIIHEKERDAQEKLRHLGRIESEPEP
jgi:cytochrome bd-type quinol oxidase subunit 2